MFDILFARTFVIVWVMLLITALFSYLNKKIDWKNGWGIVIMSFVVLFAIMMFGDSFPINLVLVWIFSAIMWWMISPAIRWMGDNFKAKKFIKERWIVLNKWETLSDQQMLDLVEYLKENRWVDEWNRIVSMAMFSTSLAVFATASLVFLTNLDFGFLGWFLFIALLILIIMGLLNIFFFKSRVFSLVRAYLWVLIFTWYLLFDFNTLEKMAWNETWGTAVSISVSLYLDIINLFLDILQILSDN